MLHQFRTDDGQAHRPGRQRHGLAMVQHVDGFGSQAQKLATYHTVAKPKQFHMGFKLFYDEDTHLFRPREVLQDPPEGRVRQLPVARRRTPDDPA